MALHVTVKWSNADTELLPEKGATILLYADGTALPSKDSPGRRDFQVPDGTAAVKLTATFVATLGPVSGAIPQSGPSPRNLNAPVLGAEVLRIEQTYDVVGGTALRPRAIPDFQGAHPLATVKGIAGVHGGALIKLRTEFVDITPFWTSFAEGWAYHMSAREPGTQILVLGHTGGTPKIWFASLPDGCAGFNNGFQSCLVFYRPANYRYARVAQPHQASAVTRYLLMPAADSVPGTNYWMRDHANATDGYHLMRCRFDDSLVQCHRALVMLHPWPSGGDYGVSATAALPSLCDKAIRFLWAKGLVCKGTGNVRLGRLGISAFSFGGNALWPALTANVRRIDEVYAFDCVATAAAAPTIIQWYTGRAEARLRMVGGAYNIHTHNSILASIEQLDNFHGPRSRLTLAIASSAVFDPGKNTVWEHYIKDTPSLRADADARHQFTVCGGQMMGGATEPYDLDLVETYLLHFLRESAFLHL